MRGGCLFGVRTVTARRSPLARQLRRESQPRMSPRSGHAPACAAGSESAYQSACIVHAGRLEVRVAIGHSFAKRRFNELNSKKAPPLQCSTADQPLRVAHVLVLLANALSSVIQSAVPSCQTHVASSKPPQRARVDLQCLWGHAQAIASSSPSAPSTPIPTILMMRR